MDNFVHMDEKWFDLRRVNDTYYLLPGEPTPLRTMKNKNSIGKVMFFTAAAMPRYDESGEVTFDGKIGTWAFVEEAPAPKKSKLRPIPVTKCKCYSRRDERVHVQSTGASYSRQMAR